MLDVRRREFIVALGGATVARPLAARAQQGKIRRVGALLPVAADDAEFQVRLAAFQQELAISGWAIGRNVRSAPDSSTAWRGRAATPPAS